MTTTTAKSRNATYSKGERTREKIKKTIRQAVAKKEVSEITLADICKSAKVTTGAFYFHFNGKEDALDAAAADEFDELYGTLIKSEQRDDLEAFLSELVQKLTEYHASAGMRPKGLQVTITSSPIAHDSWIAARRPLVDILERLITEARKEKGLPTDASRYLAYYLLNAIEDLGMDAFQWGNPTIQRFASDPSEWNRRQVKMWPGPSWRRSRTFPKSPRA